MCNGAILYINICFFISDFRSVVNFIYVSSSKFCQIKRISYFRPLPYQGFEVVKHFEAFQNHQVTDKPDYWHFENKSKTAAFAKLFIQS